MPHCFQGTISSSGDAGRPRVERCCPLAPHLPSASHPGCLGMFGLEHLPHTADPAQVLKPGTASRDEGGKRSPNELAGQALARPCWVQKGRILVCWDHRSTAGLLICWPTFLSTECNSASQHCSLDSEAPTPGTNKGFRPLPLPTLVIPGTDGESEEAF